jgi:hypothetical protein
MKRSQEASTEILPFDFNSKGTSSRDISAS